MAINKSIIIKLFLLSLIAVGVFFIWSFKFASHYPEAIDLRSPADFWGVTFSKRYSTFLGLSWKETYTAIINDLGIKRIRLPLYWTDLEPKLGQYDFSDYDWMIDQAHQNNVIIIPVLGRRQPRWPECHTPSWAQELKEEQQQQKILSLIKKTIERYKTYDNIEAWQVENEALLNSFGICPDADPNFLAKEIALVRDLDTRPIIITGSGELSNWKQESKLGDYFGTTLYRVVWNKYVGYLRYGLSTNYYQSKARKANLSLDRAIIAELQTEPWSPGDIKNLSVKDADKSFSLDQFKANLQFAINTKFKHTYLWGVEWWYYKKLNGQPEYWNLAKSLKW